MHTNKTGCLRPTSPFHHTGLHNTTFQLEGQLCITHSCHILPRQIAVTAETGTHKCACAYLYVCKCVHISVIHSHAYICITHSCRIRPRQITVAAETGTLNMLVHICMYVSVYIYQSYIACMHMHHPLLPHSSPPNNSDNRDMYMPKYAYVHVCVYVYVCVYRSHTYICLYMHTYTYMHRRIIILRYVAYVCIYTCFYMNMYIYVRRRIIILRYMAYVCV